MSIAPNSVVRKDPDSELVYEFDWSAWLGAAEIDTYAITIDGPDSDLTQDNDSLVSGNQKVDVRLLGGTVGKSYTVTCQIVTDEAVPQTEDASITVQIRQH